MSAPVHRIPAKARALLLERGWTVSRLAAYSRLPLRNVQWALSNHLKARPGDRHRIAAWLTPDEIKALGWRGLTLLPVEQFRKAS